MLVCADADLERAAAGAVYGAFANSGQVCVSTERVYVVEGVADEFVRKVVEKTGELRQGAGGEADVGPMILARSSRSSSATSTTPWRAARACSPAGAATRPRRASSSSPRCWSTWTTRWP